MTTQDRYEIHNDLHSEITRTGGRKAVVLYKVWDKQTGQYVGTRFRTRKQAAQLIRLLLATPDLR